MEDKPVYPSDVADKVLVRMPDGMRDRLKALGKANKRTLNAEIIARLESSMSPLPQAQAGLGPQFQMVNSGMQLADMAAKLVLIERPEVKSADSFELLLKTLDATLKIGQVAPGADPTEAHGELDGAAEALIKLTERWIEWVDPEKVRPEYRGVLERVLGGSDKPKK